MRRPHFARGLTTLGYVFITLAVAAFTAALWGAYALGHNHGHTFAANQMELALEEAAGQMEAALEEAAELADAALEEALELDLPEVDTRPEWLKEQQELTQTHSNAEPEQTPGPEPAPEPEPEPEPVIPTADQPAKYTSTGMTGTVKFDHSNNDGKYQIGQGEYSFTLATSSAGDDSVYFSNDPEDIKSVGHVYNATEFSHIGDATKYDTSSRTRLVEVGEAMVTQNAHGNWAAIIPDRVQSRGYNADQYSLTFRYKILPDKKHTF